MLEQLDQFQSSERPRFRTFYDRETYHLPVYKEVNTAENVVKPNLTLSIRDIFDRWQRNLPLDTVLRNGMFSTEKYDEELKDEDFEGIDLDVLDPSELYELGEEISSRLMRLSKDRAISDEGAKSDVDAKESFKRDDIVERSETAESDGDSESP